jgi:hypothetical protein
MELSLVRNQTDNLTVVVVCGIPEVAPRVYSVLKSPSTRPGIDTVLDFECITELEEPCSGANGRLQGLPRKQVVSNC